ncbi:HDOD domain-containing protein [Amphritea balenae]|uniref:HDOD domain-containing protein n=1 Tax=Amphritea balenae TaxID=452629 RepID=UPI001476616B|nr:HDOD domain-containing protein [Amphritea balenae]GGK75924.1 hypothetical protein GCM10007941_27620 [Amphritea balenae]
MQKTQRQVLNIEYVTKRIDRLPLLPAVVLELTQLSQDADDFYEKMAELASQDPPLSARILGFANTISPASDKQINNVHQALMKLGVIKTLNLINELTTVSAFSPTKPEYKTIWRHSVETARFSRFLAVHIPEFDLSDELAYSCGLLHDLGRFVLLQVAVHAVESVDAAGWDSPQELPEVEQSLFGFNHAEVGRIAAEHWQLPDIICKTLRFHHHYNLWEMDEVPRSFLQLLTVVQFADFLSVLLIQNPQWRSWSETELSERIRSYCTHSDWPDIAFPIDKLVKALPLMSDECEKILLQAGVA